MRRKSTGAISLLLLLAACQSGNEVTGNAQAGSLAVVVSGLPAGAAAAVTVTGGGGYQKALSGSETLSGLAPGSYSVAAAAVTVAGDRYAPAVASRTVTVSAHNPPDSVSVGYSVTTGRIQVTISGVPEGGSGAVQISGPESFNRTVTASHLVTGVSPGEYTVTSSLVTSGGFRYLAAPSNQAITVTAGATVSVSVNYSASTGSLAVTIAGLPGGAAAQVTISGPGGFSQSLGESQTLSELNPGSYIVTAAPVTVSGTNYSPLPSSQTATITAGAESSATVAYAPEGGGGATLDLRVDAVYLTQATQRYDGSVPLVAGRKAYLRAFVLANGANSARPTVRVRLYQGSSLVQTYTINPPGSSVPSAVSEGTLSASWNVLVPGSLVQPGLRLLADVDPSNGVSEADESNNQFPLSGSAAAVEVRALPPFAVRFVPVLQQVNGLTGNVTAGNLDSFLADLRQELPVGSYDADLHAVYTTTAPALQSNNANGAWTAILSEMLALRSADASTRYYYGVVRTTYTSGTAGLGYIGGNAHTAVGWDYLPSGSGVMAHEVGHNLGRQHAPCGNVLGPDPAYPYPGGTIGVWGLALNGLVLKSPSTADLMGYCQPSWVSDYNWSAMVSYRQGGPNNSGKAGQSSGGAEGLLVWGRVTPDELVLEPAFRVPSPAAAATASAAGANQVELLRDDGSVIRTARFGALEIGDLPDGPEQHFAFVLPLGPDSAALAGLRVRVSGRSAVRQRVSGRGPGDPEPVVARVDARRVAVRWNASRYPMALVRDAATGRVLSFARGGNVVLWAQGAELQLQFSDGVRTTARRERIVK